MTIAIQYCQFTEIALMSSPAINTVIKMMESLSEDKQNDLVEHLGEYIQNSQEEVE